MKDIALQKVIYNLLSKEFQKEILPEFWLVSIVRIIVSPDCSYWDVFISNMPVDDSVLDYVNSRLWHFQSLINKSLTRRRVPKLRFHFDTNWDFLIKLEEI